MSFIRKCMQGKKAFKEGLKLEDNPYSKPVANAYDEITRKENFDWWNIGWKDAQGERIVNTASKINNL